MATATRQAGTTTATKRDTRSRAHIKPEYIPLDSGWAKDVDGIEFASSSPCRVKFKGVAQVQKMQLSAYLALRESFGAARR
jgi:hypothetical protein